MSITDDFLGKPVVSVLVETQPVPLDASAAVQSLGTLVAEIAQVCV